MKSLLKNKRALSPVIATVILVAVTIVVAVSVAYWMGTISSSYTAHEQIEMPTSYASLDATLFNGTGGWKIYIGLKNTGSADSTIDNIFLNDRPLKDYPAGNITLFKTDDTVPGNEEDLTAISVPVTKGTEEDLIIWIQNGVEGCNSGVTINLKIHSAAGNSYPVSVKLP